MALQHFGHSRDDVHCILVGILLIMRRLVTNLEALHPHDVTDNLLHDYFKHSSTSM